MSIQELKTSINGLQVGMYVTRLDRPWLETPFPLQGLLINTADDISMLRRYASYVYIDVERGPSPDPEFWITDTSDGLSLEAAEMPPMEVFNRKPAHEYSSLKKCFYEIEATFEEEFRNASEISDKVQNDYKKVMNDLQNGKGLDINLVKEGVTAMVSSILRNPSAFALLAQLEKTSDYAYNHSLGTSVWCAQFGRHLGLERSEIDELALGGMLLDIGKVKLPQKILNKRDTVTPEDCKIIKMHVGLSVKILALTENISRDVMRMVATHHERANGNGYPEGIENDVIPIYGRIAGIVDSYDAMTSKRPHTDVCYTPHEAINELYKCRHSIFQEELIEQFIQTVGLYPTGSLVEFNTGEVGVVLEVNDLKRLFPTVMMVLDKDKQPLDDFITVNLSRHTESELKVEKALPYGAYGIKMDQLFL